MNVMSIKHNYIVSNLHVCVYDFTLRAVFLIWLLLDTRARFVNDFRYALH